MTDLLDFVSLSLLPPWCWRVAADWLRRGDSPGVVFRRLADGCPPREPDQRGDVRSLAADAIRRADTASIAAIPWSDAAYPAALTTIVDPPPVLWSRGRLDVLSAPSVAIVGSRAASPYGLAVAEQLAADLAASGVVIVSGLARGVDSAAHRGALSAGGRTVAVLGSGADVIYPPEHAALAAAIDADRRRRQRTGARHRAAAMVLSTPQPDHQRLVSSGGRDRGEREERVADYGALRARSGARRPRGARQRSDGRSRGAHALLRDGAKIVESADDILEELGMAPAVRPSGCRGSGPRSRSDPRLPGAGRDL